MTAIEESEDGAASVPDFVTVVVPTYKRPDVLRRALDSCFRQRGLPAGAFEILVVDNCPLGSAQQQAQAAADIAPVPVRYVHEPMPGVSHARNRGLREARGAFAALLDDDEVAHPDWLVRMLATARASGADAVLGPVLARAHDGADAFARACAALLTCSVDAPSGTEVESSVATPFYARDTSRCRPRLASGNALLRLASPAVARARFDPRLARTGGEDVLFFSQLLQDGGRIVWCAEGLVSEDAGASRTNLRFVAARAFRGGQATVFVPAMLRMRRYDAVVTSMAVGLVQALLFAPPAVAAAALGSPRAPALVARTMYGLGKLLWMSGFRRHVYGERLAGAGARAAAGAGEGAR